MIFLCSSLFDTLTRISLDKSLLVLNLMRHLFGGQAKFCPHQNFACASQALFARGAAIPPQSGTLKKLKAGSGRTLLKYVLVRTLPRQRRGKLRRTRIALARSERPSERQVSPAPKRGERCTRNVGAPTGAGHYRYFIRDQLSRILKTKDVGAPTGGGGEIRTHGGLTPSLVFKTSSFDHSDTPPVYLFKKIWLNKL